MADNNIKIWAELTLDDRQIKTEFTKAWEEAWKSVAEWLDKQQGTIVDKINETVDLLKTKIQTLQEIDWNLVDPTKTEQDIKFLEWELNTLWYTVENLKYWRGEFWEEWEQAFNTLKETANEYEEALYNSMDQLQTLWSGVEEAMDWAEEQTKETTEAVKELNETANQWISENGWLWKMLKFLSSKEIINFFYKNLVKIWSKLIELSGDSEKLESKRQPIQERLEAVWWYIGKGLTPAVSGAIDEIDTMSEELMKTGEWWSSALQKIQQWVYIIGQAFVWVIKIIKQFWQLLWTQIGNWYVLLTSFTQDVYDTAKSLIEGIWNADNWSALWNNIKYWIVDWVNGAIDSLNGLLSWINDKLWVNLWTISKFDAWSKQSYNFWNLEFWRTKEALKDITKTNVDFVNELWDEWSNFWDNAKQGRNDLKKTSVDTNKKIKEDTQKSIWGWSKDSVKSAYEELEEEAKDVWEEMDGLVEEHQKSYEKLTEQIEKVWDEYTKLREEAKKTRDEAEKALENYNDELEKAQWEAITSLWERYVELKKDLIGVDEWMKKIAEDLSRKEIQNLWDMWYSEYRGYDLKKIIDLKEKLDEIKLIEENTTEEQRKADEFIKETSKTQEILNKLKEQEAELEAKKTAEMEKQAIAQALMNQEDGQQYIKTLEDKGTFYYDTVKKQWEQVQNEDNIQYAKQLENQVVNLNDQLKEYKSEKDKEVEILIDTTARKIELENEFQNVFMENVKKQEKELDNLIAKEQRLIDKRREYLSMSGGSSHNAYWGTVLEWHASIVWENWPEQIIARQSSYIQPRNAWNSYSTINNSSNLSINGLELGNFATIDDMLDALREKLTYRN